MQKFISILKQLFKNRQFDVKLDEATVDTAAFSSLDEAKELHKGKRRLKENYTSHWDLDYLPRNEVEEIMADDEQTKPSR